MLDPITVEVVRHKLEGIANEMQQTLLRSSFSPIVKEGLDASSSLFTIAGETLAQATAIPIHLATLIPVVARIIETFPLVAMQPGDVYCMNDPYLGGTHLPDVALVQPVFAAGRPIALSATMTHHQDMGGMSPGSVPTTATEIYQEGLRLPPLKFREAGRYNETLVAIIRRNVRIPDAVMGDLNAQLAACNVGARRIAELASTLGDNQALAIFDELMDRSEKLTRAALRSIPEGTYKLCGLQRQRWHRARQAYPFRGRRHGAGRQLPLRLHRLLGPGARAVQLRAVGLARRRLLRGARAHRSRRSRPTPAASGRSRSNCRREASSILASLRRSTRARPPSSASPAASWAR